MGGWVGVHSLRSHGPLCLVEQTRHNKSRCITSTYHLVYWTHKSQTFLMKKQTECKQGQEVRAES